MINVATIRCKDELLQINTPSKSSVCTANYQQLLDIMIASHNKATRIGPQDTRAMMTVGISWIPVINDLDYI